VRQKYERWLDPYAAAGNPAGARLAGVRVDLIRAATFVVSGGAAALGGVLLVSRVLAAGRRPAPRPSTSRSPSWPG